MPKKHFIEALLKHQSQAILDDQRIISYPEFYQLIIQKCVNLESYQLKSGDCLAVALPNSTQAIAIILAAMFLDLRIGFISTRLPYLQQESYAKEMSSSLLIRKEGWHILRRKQDIKYSPGTIIYTSGSSGRAKGVLLSWENHYASALSSSKNIPLNQDDCWQLSLPLYHVGGLAIILRCILSGACIAIGNSALSLCSHTSMVPTQLTRLLSSNVQLPKLKVLLIGGAPVLNRLIDQSLEAKLPIHRSYGMSEMASQITCTPQKASKKQLYSSGSLLLGQQLKIAEDGEILVKGASLAIGYLNQKPFKGYFSTGDLGYLDAKGNLHVLGRKDKMFISGGENIHAEEVELALMSCKGVKFAEVKPVDDLEYGQRPIAYLEGDYHEFEVRKELMEKLPKFKQPVKFLRACQKSLKALL